MKVLMVIVLEYIQASGQKVSSIAEMLSFPPACLAASMSRLAMLAAALGVADGCAESVCVFGLVCVRICSMSVSESISERPSEQMR